MLCAGPERSGSTWLFNALRLLYEEADEALHAYWMHNITDAKLQQRHCGINLYYRLAFLLMTVDDQI